MNDLKVCPFCGKEITMEEYKTFLSPHSSNKKEKNKSGTIYTSNKLIRMKHSTPVSNCWLFENVFKENDGEYLYYSKYPYDDLVKLWNTRPSHIQ